MGCEKKKMGKLLVTILIITLVITAIISPGIMALEDTITVTFNPTGGVTLDVAPEVFNFSTVTSNANEETADSFILYNNGTMDMQTTCNTNSSTLNLTLDADGTPASDNFSLRFTSATNFEGDDAYIPTASSVTLNNSLAPDASDSFKITIYLGVITVDHPWQNTTVNFTGVVSP